MEKEKEILMKIDTCLKEQGMSKRELAERLGCSARLVHYWVKGERGISIDMADRALRTLGAVAKLGK